MTLADIYERYAIHGPEIIDLRKTKGRFDDVLIIYHT